jgi:integrase
VDVSDKKGKGGVAVAHIRFKNGKWRAIVRRKELLARPWNGTFDSEEEARAYCDRLEGYLDHGLVPPGLMHLEKTRAEEGAGGCPATLAELIDAMLDAAHVSNAYRPLLATIKAEAGGAQVVQIDYAWVEDWIRQLKREQRLTPGTIRKRKGALGIVFAWAALRYPAAVPVNWVARLTPGYSTYSPADIAAAGLERRDAERDRRLEEGEDDAIMAVLHGAKPEHRQRALTLEYRAATKALYVLLRESAMRLREAYTLERRQLEFVDAKGKAVVHLSRTKNGDRRDVPLSTVATAALKTYIAAVEAGEDGMANWRFEGGRLFPFWNGDRSQQALEKATARLSKLFGRVFQHAGCDGLRVHDLRHEATCQLYLRTTLSDLRISKITGHRDLRQLRRYASLRGAESLDEMP